MKNRTDSCLDDRPRLAPLMLAGTGSDVGKSVIATGLCRIFREDGYDPAPFKAQNMALNSYVTPDGLEIGRAQAVQAEAAGIACRSDMNPILLKPCGDMTSQVVINGRPAGNRKAGDYFCKEGREELRRQVHEAYDRLASCYNPIVLEGAGSIAEINLSDIDLVNMSMARYAGADVILVADIDRGGVFASAYGSIMLQTPDDRRRIKGIIINKFRGDLSLFDEGRRMMERVCGVPVLGVVPYYTDINIDEEDSVSLAKKADKAVAGAVNIAVVLLPHISNFTDFDTLERDGRVHLYYTFDPDEVAKADVVLLPGTKSTLSDLAELKRSGVADAVTGACRNGKIVVGICGGYQMMGRRISDPEGVEGEPSEALGLGLLPVDTEMTPEKVTRRTKFRFMDDDTMCEGYEIHMGLSRLDSGAVPLNRLSDGSVEGCQVDGRCMGTYMHGLLDNAVVIDRLLAGMADKGDVRAAAAADYRESQYAALARFLRQHIDMDRLYKILQDDGKRTR